MITHLDFLISQLTEGGKTLEKIGKDFSTSKQNISQFFKKRGINPREIEKERRKNPIWYARHWRKPQLQTRDWLLEQQKKGNLGLENLAKQLGISVYKLRLQIARLGMSLKEYYPKKGGILIPCSYCGKILKRARRTKARNYKNAWCNRQEQAKWFAHRKLD